MTMARMSTSSNAGEANSRQQLPFRNRPFAHSGKTGSMIFINYT